ncbi:MAG: alpha/beta hydrolase [Bryobacteraceae bacterium]
MIERVWIRGAHTGAAPIVMLHEGLGSVAHWRDFPERLALASGTAVFVYSRHGHGKSSPPAEARESRYLHREAFEALPALLAEEGIERPVLFGHSDGASIALLHASRFPVAALVLEAPHVFVEDVTVAGVARMKTAYETSDLPQRLGRHHADADSLFRVWSGIWLDPKFRSWNIEDCLERITCPVLVIQGEDDEYGTVAQVEAIRVRVPTAEVIMLPACGHAPHRDQRDAVLARVREFLEGCASAKLDQ